MKTFGRIVVACAAMIFVEVVVDAVLGRNLEAGVYPVDADSIGIALAGSLITATASVSLLVLAIVCRLGPRWLELFGALGFLVAGALTGICALAWAMPDHYPIAASYGVVSMGCGVAAVAVFRHRR